MLALIAGTGDLPPTLVARLPEKPLICAMDGFAPTLTPDMQFRIEHLGSFLADLKARGVTCICMAGAVKRPAVDPTAIDAATAPLVPALMAAMAKGDDGALRGVIAILEAAGFTVAAAHEIAPDLLPDAGVLTSAQPGEAAKQDAVVGEQTIAAMGRADTGQACVVQGGRVLTREDADGTDAMLRHGALDARGAVLFKGPKPDQDRRADLPVIGRETAIRAAAAGLRGIVIEAGGVMVLDLPAVLKVLEDAGMFLWVRPKGRA